MPSFEEALQEWTAKAGKIETLKNEAWVSQLAKSRAYFDRVRLYKVQLCKLSVTSEIEVQANIMTVDRLAESRAEESKVIATTAPFAFRRFVQVRKDPRDEKSPLVWAEVVHEPVDPFDPSSPAAWRVRR